MVILNAIAMPTLAEKYFYRKISRLAAEVKLEVMSWDERFDKIVKTLQKLSVFVMPMLVNLPVSGPSCRFGSAIDAK